MPAGQGVAGASKLPLPIRARPPSPPSPPPQTVSTSTFTPNHKATTTLRRSSSRPPRPVHDDADLDHSHQPPQTPTHALFYRASAPPTSATRYSIRTPASQLLPDFRRSNLLSASIGRSAGKYGVPTQFTPHGRAAIRAIDSRRAALNDINTPGRNRRRSMRDQRETPRDILRALSKALAPTTNVIGSTSSSSSPGDDTTLTGARSRRSRSRAGKKRRQITIPEDPEDSDDDFPIDRPRFSLPINEDDDSDDDLPRPPRSSGLEDSDNYTMQSIEGPRRTVSGPGRDRFSLRTSMGDLQDDDRGDDGFDSAFFPPLNWEVDTAEAVGADDDATLERIDDENGRRDTMLGGRISDFGAIDFTLDAGDQSTVMMAPHIESSPRRESLSPDNEPFGFDVDAQPPPLDGDDDEDDNNNDNGTDFDTAPMDLDQDDYNQDMELDQVTAESLIARQVSKSTKRGRVHKPGKKISRHGIEYPSLPVNVVKRLAQRFAGNTKISPDTLNALMQASDWFFDQLGEDLRAYANHAKGRTTINESDMLTLLRRQRQTSASATPYALAQKHLPRELVQEVRMPAPAPNKKRARQAKAGAGKEGTLKGPSS